MRMFGQSARLGALTIAVAMSLAGAMQAATITVDFSGSTGSNLGYLGPGTVAGSISYDTAGATSAGSATFLVVFSNIDFTTGAGTVTSSDTPTDSNHAFNVAPNLLDQDFSANRPNQKWAGKSPTDFERRAAQLT